MHTNILNTKHRLAIVAGGLLFASAIAMVSHPAHAATAPNVGQALEIGPPVVNLVADPGQKVTATLSLRDISSTSLIVTNEVNDFTASGEDGTPKISLDPGENSPYSLKSWITPIPSITLKPRDVKSVPVTITVPANASPGGYYSVIRFTGVAPEVQGTGVSLNASLGALVFIRVNGAAKESVEIAEFSLNRGEKSSTFFEVTPINFVQRIKNTGNIYEQPTGLVTITDMFGHTTATLPVNADQHIILSNTIRKFSEPLDNTVLGDRVLFGMYHAHLDMTYGTTGQKVSKDVTFWVIPYKLIIFIVILIIVLITALVIFIKRYNKMIVKRAQKAQKKR